MRNTLLLFTLGLLFQASAQAAVLDIYIIAGQSNANGRGLVSDLDPGQVTQNASFFGSWHSFLNNATDLNVLDGDVANNEQHYSGWLTTTVAGETRAGVSTVANGNYATTFGGSDRFGPEIGFVARANEINLTTNPLAIVKYAVDGSAINNSVNPSVAATTSDWDLSATGDYAGDAWRGFQSALSNAVAALPAGTTPNFKGMIWWQGENGTSAADLNIFINGVRNHLGTNYGVANFSEFPVVITGNDRWGVGLEAGVAGVDDYVGFVNSDTYGQDSTNVHIGSGEFSQSLDVDGNGINDMFDIGVAYADVFAEISPTVVPEPSMTLLVCSGMMAVLFRRRRW